MKDENSHDKDMTEYHNKIILFYFQFYLHQSVMILHLK